MNARDYAETIGKSYDAFIKDLQTNGGGKYGAVKDETGHWVLPDPKGIMAGVDGLEDGPRVLPESDESKQEYDYYNAKLKKTAYLNEYHKLLVSRGKLVERRPLESAWKKTVKRFSAMSQALPSKMKNTFGDEFTDRMNNTLADMIDEMLVSLAQ